MYQSHRYYRGGVRQSGTGFIVPAVGGATGRALVLNGSNQNANVSLPVSAPWNSMTPFKLVFRMRALDNSAADRRAFTWRGGFGDLQLLASNGGTRLDFTDTRDSINIFHTPTSLTDMIVKLQFDQANATPRWTMESWKGDGTGRVEGTVALVTTSNYNLADSIWIGSTHLNVQNSNGHYDWCYVQSGVDALNTFPGAEPAVGTYMALWKFDADDGTDSSGNGLTLTLVNSPTFENTP